MATNLRAVAGVTWLGVMAVAPLALWWPSPEGWSAVCPVTLGLWLLWLCWRIADGRKDVPGNWLHAALAGVILVLLGHLVRHGRGPGQDAHALWGQLDMTMVLHAAMVSLWTLVSQDLTGTRGPRAAVLGIIGVAVVLGASLGLAVNSTQPQQVQGRPMLALLAVTGIAILGVGDSLVTKGGRWRRWASPLAIVVAAGTVIVGCPAILPAVAVAVGIAAAATALWWPRGRWPLLSAGVAAMALGGARLWRLGWLAGPVDLPLPARWFGLGEQAMGFVYGWGPAPAFLLGVVGCVGLLWAGGWMGVGLVGMLARSARTAGGEPSADAPPARSAWTRTAAVAGAALATAAVLAPGGLFSPAANLLFAAAWGMLASLLGVRARRYSGWVVLAIAMGLMLTMGLASQSNLMSRAAKSYGLHDLAMHMVAGWLTTQTLLWLLGRWWWLGVLLSLGASGLGELLQYLLTRGRSAQWDDFIWHAVGTVVATGVWALCRASLWAEVSDPKSRSQKVESRE